MDLERSMKWETFLLTFVISVIIDVVGFVWLVGYETGCCYVAGTGIKLSILPPHRVLGL
jgi:hypothetical protein